MKKIYGFLGAAAILSMVACSKNADLGGGNVPNGGTAGDLFMTMNIAMASQVGTRTETPNQGYEVGQNEENRISSALIILAQSDNAAYGTEKFTIKFTSETGTNLQNTETDSDHTSGTVDNDPDSGNYLEPDPTHQNRYTAKFTFDREALKAALTTPTDVSDGDHNNVPDNKKGDFVIFMVANPTPAIRAAATVESDLQSVITAAQNAPTYSGATVAPNAEIFWQDNYFVMSSAWAAKKTIYLDEIADGTHITKNDPYHLGTVTVQRVMSRFDLAVGGNHINFQGAGNGQSDEAGVGQGLEQVKVEFDAVAMVNMAKSAYLYKVMSGAASDLTDWNNGSGTPTKFGDERDSDYSDWWTFTPKQEAYFNPLFDGVAGLGLADLKSSQVKAKDFESFFTGSSADYTLISNITKEDNSFDFKGTGQHTAGTGDYRIWRYAMENTNPDAPENQVNGNSTGIIFRAKLTEVMPTGPEDLAKYGDPRIPTSYTGEPSEKKAPKIYAYNDVILGTAEQLFEYATKSKKDPADPVWDDVNRIYWGIIEAKYSANWDDQGTTTSGVPGYKEKTENSWWIETEDHQSELKPGEIAPGGVTVTVYHHGELEAEGDEEIMAKLVKAGFTIYTPDTTGDSPVYYCYYIYWNRHNDNGKNTIMGIMEFATVRNNVYKLSVNAVKRLGHPGENGNDPYPPTPGTPDEDDKFWLDVECVILPWEVRINNIEF